MSIRVALSVAARRTASLFRAARAQRKRRGASGGPSPFTVQPRNLRAYKPDTTESSNLPLHCPSLAPPPSPSSTSPTPPSSIAPPNTLPSSHGDPVTVTQLFDAVLRGRSDLRRPPCHHLRLLSRISSRPQLRIQHRRTDRDSTLGEHSVVGQEILHSGNT